MKIAICVGHSRWGDKGSVSVDGTSEWEYNVKVADYLENMLKDQGFEVLLVDQYPRNNYVSAMRWLGKHLKEWGADLAIELHFNGAGPKAEGYEQLYWKGSSNGRFFAFCLNEAQKADDKGAPNRGIKYRPGERPSEKRGIAFLKYTHCPAVINEPFFGSSQTDWDRWQYKKKELATIINNGITKYAASHMA